MKTKMFKPVWALVAAMVLLVGVSHAVAADAEPAKTRVVADNVKAGDARCTRCHSDVNGDEIDNYPVLPIATTKHGTRADSRTPTCVSCHGESEKHLKQEGKVRALPDMPYGKKMVSNNPVAHNKACLNCHEGDKLMHWGASIHSRRDVACSDCHQMHVTHDRATTREKISASCMSCHKDKRAQFERPNHHPVPEGKMTCVDCHNPHGSAGPKLMVRDSINETCYSCHMQYRGPFLWNHQPVTQDCALCHNPHGTAAPALLKQRAPFLCQQCHEPTSHRGNLPGITGTGATAYGNASGSRALTQGRGCVNCHNNIHGGSNPTNASNSRTLRR